MDINSLKRDLSAVNEGEWVDNIPKFGDIRLKVRGLNSDLYRSTMANKEQAIPLADRERDGRPKSEAYRKILLETLAEVILLDWEGFTSGDKPLAYSKKTAEKFILDPDYEVLVDSIIFAARVVDHGKDVQKDANLKN